MKEYENIGGDDNLYKRSPLLPSHPQRPLLHRLLIITLKITQSMKQARLALKANVTKLLIKQQILPKQCPNFCYSYKSMGAKYLGINAL